MMESYKEGCSQGIACLTDVRKGGRGDGPLRPRVAHSGPSHDIAGPAHGDGRRDIAIAALIRQRLEEHPHFRGRTWLLRIESNGESVVLAGRVPSFYLKQLLQEAISLIPDVENIDNQVDVLWP